jgi:hypothetical protein
MFSTSVVMPNPNTSISSAEPRNANIRRTGIAHDLRGLVVGVGEHPAERSRMPVGFACARRGAAPAGSGGGATVCPVAPSAPSGRSAPPRPRSNPPCSR